MLARRRQAHRLTANTGSGYGEASIEQIVEERLRGFAPFPLHSLDSEDPSYEEEFPSIANEEDKFQLLKQRLRISHMVIMVYLHIGNDPPDCPRIEPCAKLECWTDPTVAQTSQFAANGGRAYGSEGIAEALEKQFRTSIIRDQDVTAHFAVENSIDSARLVLSKSRRIARSGRLLVYYNGHGMPQATEQGEIWLFNKERTHYVPLNILVMSELVESPAIYIFDCNSSGAILKSWLNNKMNEQRPQDLFICACSSKEMLPLSPALPADMLTSCLTTPLKMALEWYIGFSHHKVILPQISDDMIRNIPGSITDLTTPLGELQWILTTITDSVAWCTLPPSQYQYLYRQEGSTAALFRNAILADRLMHGAGCTPVTYPPLSEEAHRHPLWELWVYSIERVISQLPSLLASNSTESYVKSSFFDDQLTAFDIWINSGDLSQLPEQLPSVIFALYQSRYHIKVFLLLIKYLDSCRPAGKHAIRCGILQNLGGFTSHYSELLLLMTLLWMQVIRADPAEGCGELQRSLCEKNLTEILKINEKSVKLIPVSEDGVNEYQKTETSRSKSSRGASTTMNEAGNSGNSGNGTTKASKDQGEKELPVYYIAKNCSLNRCKSITCYVLCQFIDQGEKQCLLCWNNRLLGAAFPCLSSDCTELQSWACLVLSKLFSGLRFTKNFASQECTKKPELFTDLLQSRSPVTRSSCVTLLASFVGTRVDLLPSEQQLRRLHMEKSLLIKLRNYLFDASVNVRQEIIFFCCQILYNYRGVLRTFSGSSSSSSAAGGDAGGVGGHNGLNGSIPINEYVAEVGRERVSWQLEESEVGVKSQLHASRPTVNFLFDDSKAFDIPALTADDPLPPTPHIMPEKLCPAAKVIIEGLLHDAAQMLCILSSNCDANLVTNALRSLMNESAPASLRFASEAHRNMSTVQSFDYWRGRTEADRTRAASNADIMRQLVLDLKNRRPENHTGLNGQTSSFNASVGAEGSASVGNGGAGKVDPWSVGLTSLNTAAKYQIISSVIRSDTIVCADFRVLEASKIVATKNQRIHYISYDSYNSQEIVNSFQLHLSAPVHDIKVINDLSEDSGILVVNKKGGFSLLKNCWTPEYAPVEVAVFSACPPPADKKYIDLKTTYKNSEAILFYGGPIGPSGQTTIHTLSLATEQVTQRIEIAGGATLTTLINHPSQRSLLAGFSDTVVHYYDERQGQLGMVGTLQCGNGPSNGNVGQVPEVEPILGVGPILSGTGHYIAAATRTALKLFDVRKLREPVQTTTCASLYGNARPSSLTADKRRPFITNCAVGVFSGIMGVSFSDSTYAAYNYKGQILSDKPIPVSTYASPPTDLVTREPLPLASILPRSCIAHPLRPLMSFGCDLMIVQL